MCHFFYYEIKYISDLGGGGQSKNDFITWGKSIFWQQFLSCNSLSFIPIFFSVKKQNNKTFSKILTLTLTIILILTLTSPSRSENTRSLFARKNGRTAVGGRLEIFFPVWAYGAWVGAACFRSTVHSVQMDNTVLNLLKCFSLMSCHSIKVFIAFGGQFWLSKFCRQFKICYKLNIFFA